MLKRRILTQKFTIWLLQNIKVGDLFGIGVYFKGYLAKQNFQSDFL